MILTIYKRAFDVLMKKPLALWGISLLEGVLMLVVAALFLGVPGIAIGINLLISTAMTMIFLRGYRGEEVYTVDLFSCFKDWATAKRVLCGMLWMLLWVFLWGLIPIVGIVFAVIRTYEYRLTPYILVTEPEISVTEAIKESSRRTKGYKGRMFGADVLLIGVIAVVELVLALFAEIPYIGWLFNLLLAVFTLCSAALAPLCAGLIRSAFYEEIRNPSIPAVPAYAARPTYPRDSRAAGQMPYADNYGGFEESRNSVTCPRCGTPLPPNSLYCTNCGVKLD